MSTAEYDPVADGQRSYAFAIKSMRIRLLETQIKEQKEETRRQSIRADRFFRALLDLANETGRDWRDYVDGEGDG